ncbi:hypothetical protein [Sphingobium fluviale]|uniref:Tetratricopeptide repeat protein n=1 Tax=Sphingobium fluviale TaxID=2506423 RepID=A0A4Q1KGB6_9SPHN|nr:hypothetical protein [Sphingobium fluviale]RXR28743.1 hypothetical protein EQG66_08445 [Sphingobium fluviale]
MKRAGLLAATLPLILGTTAPEAVRPVPAAPVVFASPAPVIPLSSARLPGFAAELANRPLPRGPELWAGPSPESALEQLAVAHNSERQAARWDYALGQIGARRASEALGALDTMLADDADMALVPGYRLARGVALAMLTRPAEALTMLTDPMLARNPEACLWRLLAQVQAQRAGPAMAELKCAIPAVNARRLESAGTFIRAAAWAAIRTNNAGSALDWLAQLPDNDGAANILRGEALIALGNLPEGRLRLDRVRQGGGPEHRIEAELALVEALVARHQMPVPEALKRTERILFLWRGGDVEQRAFTLGYDLAEQKRDAVAALRFGGMLLRYGAPGARAGEILAACQQRMFTILDPASKLKLEDAAGLFWDNRDLAPTGPRGDRMLDLLAGRLAGAGLYERAADLLSYQMRARAKDVEKGPVSAQVARLYLLGGLPGKAILALRESEQPAYPPAILAARRHAQAVALYQLGRVGEALALTEDQPEMAGLRAEMLWRRRDWRALAAAEGAVPAKGALSAVDQALILRRAVALAMLGDERGVAALRGRHGAAFARLPSGPAFALLTGPASAMTSDGITRAMAAIPVVSVAGEDDALLDALPPTPAPPPHK